VKNPVKNRFTKCGRIETIEFIKHFLATQLHIIATSLKELLDTEFPFFGMKLLPDFF
jgi:hypothetical protein